MKTIKRADALQQMDVKESTGGKPQYFSIQFYKQNGEVVSLIRARLTGLRQNLKLTRMRGIRAVDAQGNDIGHIYPVSIDNIRMFNGQQVTI